MKCILCCAGTAGHINPAIAIAEEIRKRDSKADFLFVGSGREMENRLIPEAGFSICNITSTGLQRGFGLKNIGSHLKTIRNLIIGNKQTKRILKEYKPDVVIGTGGYVCFPVLYAAHKMKIPTFIHESNAVPGLTTKLLSSVVDRVFVAFEPDNGLYNNKTDIVVCGTPIRSGFSEYTKDEAKRSLGLNDKPVVVSFWGSLGAQIPNQATLQLIKDNETSKKFYHIHATGGGEIGYRSFCDELKHLNIEPDNLFVTDIRSYIDNMPVLMKAADLILCRSGASTLGELTAIGKPALLIPSPNVTDNHQEKNALKMVDCGGAVMLTEKECTGIRLSERVFSLLDAHESLELMAEAMQKQGHVNSAEILVSSVLRYMDKGE